MNDFDIIESIKTEAKSLSVNPNALAASGLKVSVEPFVDEPRFGENAFPKVAENWYHAILPLLAKTRGFDVVEMVSGGPMLVRQREVARAVASGRSRKLATAYRSRSTRKSGRNRCAPL